MILTVSSQQAMHHSADRIVLHLCQQMDVIWASGSLHRDRTDAWLSGSREEQKLKVVIVRSEYAPAIIPASDDVVEPTGYFNSRLARHGSVRIFPRCSNINISCVTRLGPGQGQLKL